MSFSHGDEVELCSEVLRPSEVIKVVAKVKADADRNRAQEGKVDLAIISNVDTGTEDAAVVLIQAQQALNLSAGPSVSIRGSCPIYQDTTLDISQVEPGADQHDGLETANLPVQATFKIAITSRSCGQDLICFTDDIASLSDAFQEFKRLHNIAENHYFQPGTSTHRWCGAYSPGSASQGGRASQRQDAVSSLLAFGSKAVEGLPAFANSWGSSFGGLFSGATPPRPRASHPTARSMFSDDASSSSRSTQSQTSEAKVSSGSDAEILLEAPVKARLQERRTEYAASTDYSLHVCTYNVNGQFYSADLDLSAWLKPHENPDLVVVGLQEMDLRPEVVMVRHDPTVGQAWTEAILSTLNSAKPEAQQRYRLVQAKQLAGIWIALFAKSRLLDLEEGRLRGAVETSVMTGFAGFAGNKGACAIRIQLHDTALTFVCAHLAAGQDMAGRRNADFHDICKRTTFAAASDEKSRSGFTYVSIYDCGALFFFGDLNYRLDHSTEGVRQLLADKTFAPLLAHDQLKLSQTQSLAFVDYDEAPIDFPCTYKYDKGSDEYDSSEKDRRPAWTDRVLWKVQDKNLSVKCEDYNSVMELRHSDHKPVLARLKVAVDVVDAAKYDQVLAEVMKQLNLEQGES